MGATDGQQGEKQRQSHSQHGADIGEGSSALLWSHGEGEQNFVFACVVQLSDTPEYL